MKGTVLVSGAAGAIGTAVLRALVGSECPVRALVHERPVESADESARADLAEPGDLGPALEGVAGVIHLAAVTHARNPRRYRALNVDGTRRLAIAAQRAGAARFVHVSTRALSERGGAYSVSKLEAERIVSESAMEHVIVRLPEVYGPGIREGIGEIVARARGHKTIPIVGRGDDLVCPIHVEEAAAAIAAALSSDAAPGRSYTLAGECMTTREFASLCLEAFDSGRPNRLRSRSRRGRGVPREQSPAAALLSGPARPLAGAQAAPDRSRRSGPRLPSRAGAGPDSRGRSGDRLSVTRGPTERNTGARAPLSRPRIYWAPQALSGAPRRQAIFVGDYVRPEPGSEVLDLGAAGRRGARSSRRTRAQ